MGDIIIGNKEEFKDRSRKIVINLSFGSKGDVRNGEKPEGDAGDYAEYEEVKEEPITAQKEVKNATMEVVTHEAPPELPPEDKFINMVKKIITKAAEKNNQTIEAKPNGRLTPYKYIIDADLICKGLDDLRNNYPQYILNVLNGYRYKDGVTVVAPFISRILEIEGLTCKDFQKSDMQFAFEPYYEKAKSAVKRMSDPFKSKEDADLLINTFATLVKKYKKS